MNNIGYIFIVRRLGKQSNPTLSRSDSISSLELNLKIHGPCGPNAHAGADLQAFLIFCFKPNLLSAHKLTLLIYGDNTTPDIHKSFDIYCDASRQGLGCVLMQEGHVIAYASRQLRKHE